VPITLMKADRNERRLLTYAAVTHGISDPWHVLYPSLLFLVALDYPDYFFLGILANIVIASAAVSGVTSGILADRSSARVLLAVSAVLASIGCFLASIPWGQAGLAFSLFVLGIGLGIYHPVGLSAIGRNIRQKGVALGIHDAAGTIGMGLLPVALVSIGVALGWRVAFFVAGFISLVPFILIFLVPREFDRPVKKKKGDSVSLKQMFTIFRRKKVLGIYMTSIFLETADVGYSTFLPAAIAIIGGLGESRIIGVSITGLFLSLAVLAAFPGSFLGGRLAERFSPDRMLTILPLIPIPVLIWLGMTEGALWLALAAMVRFPFSMMFPVINTMLAKTLVPGAQGKGFAVSYGLGPAIGSLVALLSGAIANAYGLQWVFPVMAVFLVASSMSAQFVLRAAREPAQGQIADTPVASGEAGGGS